MIRELNRRGFMLIHALQTCGLLILIAASNPGQCQITDTVPPPCEGLAPYAFRVRRDHRL
jgi:hypothetical protein